MSAFNAQASTKTPSPAGEGVFDNYFSFIANPIVGVRYFRRGVFDNNFSLNADPIVGVRYFRRGVLTTTWG